MISGDSSLLQPTSGWERGRVGKYTITTTNRQPLQAEQSRVEYRT
jgi:hypothetical protein